MSTTSDGQSFDSAAMLAKYINLRVTGGIDDLAPHNVLSIPKEGATESQVLQALRGKLELAQRVPAAIDAEISHVRMLLHASAAVMLAQGLGLSSSLESSRASSVSNQALNVQPALSLPSDQRPITWSSRAAPSRADSPGDMIDLAAPIQPPRGPLNGPRQDAALDRYVAQPSSLHSSQANAHAALQQPAAAMRSPVEHELFVVLASCGGWNARSMHRVQMLAAARGIAPNDLVRTLERAIQRAQAPSAAQQLGQTASRANVRASGLATTGSSHSTSGHPSGPAASALNADFGSPALRSNAISSGQSGLGLPAINQTAAALPASDSARSTSTSDVSHRFYESGKLPSNQSIRQTDVPSSSEVDHESASLNHDDGGHERTKQAIKGWLIGGTTGAALLIVVALTLRYTVGRTPGAANPTLGSGTATIAGQSANTVTQQSQAAPDIAATSTNAGPPTSDPDTLQPARAAQRATSNRSVQELIAAINTAATQGGVQRQSASPKQSTGATDTTSKQASQADRVLQARDLDGSLTSFRDAIDELSQRWVSASEQQLPAMSNAVLEYLYRVGDSDAHAQAALAIIAMPAQEVFGKGPLVALTPEAVRASTLSMGLLARLQSERDLSWSMRSAIERACQDVMPNANEQARAGSTAGTLAHGSGAAAKSLVGKLLSQPRTQTVDAAGLWRAWKECASAIHTASSTAHTTLLLGALDTLIASAIPPSQHPVVLAGYRAIVPSLAWTNGREAATPGTKPHESDATSSATPTQRAAQLRLLGWLASPNAGADHLSVIIAAMIDAQTPGVDLSMSLSASANETDRAQLRERFAALFGLDGSSAESTDASSAALARWRELVAPLQTPLASQGTQRVDVLTRLSMCSYANTIAWQLALGDIEVAEASLGSASTPNAITAAGQHFSVFYLLATPDAASWGAKYALAGTNASKRLEVLQNATAIENLLEARAALDEALRGITPEHRTRARKLIETNPDNRFVLAAMLDLSNNAPAFVDLRPLYEKLADETIPAFNDPAWRISLRKAMIKRVIQSIARDNDDQLRDVMAAQRFMGRAYEDRLHAFENARRRELGQPPLAMQQRAVDPEPSTSMQGITNAVAAYSRNLYVSSDISAVTPDAALATLAQRLRNARTKPQEIVAHQLAVLDMQGFIVASRAPRNAAEASQRIASAKVAIAKAGDVLVQLQLCENAMLDLWMLAFAGSS